MNNNYDISKMSPNNIVVHIHDVTNKSELLQFLEKFCDIRILEVINQYIYGELIKYSFQIIYSDDEIIINKIFNNFNEIVKVTKYKEYILKTEINSHTFAYIEINKISNQLIKQIKSNKNNIILAFLEDFSSRISNNATIINYNSLISDIRLYRSDEYTTVAEDEDIKLVIRNFRTINPLGMEMSIVSKEDNQIIGNIEYKINLSNTDNFKYDGNVGYEIDSKYRNQGYATKAVKLLKAFILSIDDIYNKELYIATLPDNIASQKVASKCGGELFYEGEVPRSSKAHIYGKVKEVKVYRLSNN